MNLTLEQIAKTIFKVRHETRKRAKRYLREHDGTGRGDEVDSVVAMVTPEVEAIVAKMLAERTEREARSDADEARFAPRRALAVSCELVAAALTARWDQVASHVDPSWGADGLSGDEARRDAILAWGTSTPELRAAELQRLDDEHFFDDVFAGGDVAEIADAITAAVEQADCDVYERTAEEALRAAAVKDGNFTVVPFYRKTLAPDSSCECLEFEDRETALAYLLVAHDPAANRTSSYSVTLLEHAHAEQGTK